MAGCKWRYHSADQQEKKMKSAGEPAISILILWTLNKIQFTIDIDLVHWGSLSTG